MPGLVTVTLFSVTGLPEDAVQNTFCIGTSPGTLAEQNDVRGHFQDFYNFEHDVPSSASNFAVGEHLSPAISRTANPYIDITPIPFARPVPPAGLGSPEYSSEFPNDLIAPNNTTALPSEVAMCMSLRADYGTRQEEAPDDGDADGAIERPRSRRRGRVYIGPLNAGVVDASSGVPRVAAIARETLTLAAKKLDDALEAMGLGGLYIFSREDWAAVKATHVWVDDAFDIQRRRGEGPTTRNTLAL